MPVSLKINNHIANPIRVGLFGHSAGSEFRVDVDAGGKFDSGTDVVFAEGRRMVVVWDNLSGGGNPIVLFSAINMQSNTALDIKPNGITAFTPV